MCLYGIHSHSVPSDSYPITIFSSQPHVHFFSLTQSLSAARLFTGVRLPTGAWAVPQKKSNSSWHHLLLIDPQTAVGHHDSILHISCDYARLDFVQILGM